DRMQPVLEPRDHAEVAAPTPQSPIKIGVLLGARPHHLAGGGDHLRGYEIVGGEPVLAHEPAEPAAERETGDAARGNHAAGCGQAVELGFAVEIPPRDTALGTRRAPFAIDVDSPHERKVEHQSAVAHRLSGDAVTATAYCQLEAVRTREPHCVDHI